MFQSCLLRTLSEDCEVLLQKKIISIMKHQSIGGMEFQEGQKSLRFH